MKATTLNPILLVDSHHGVYSGQLAYKTLNRELKAQVRKQMTKDGIYSLVSGPNDEFYYEAIEELENCTLVFEGHNWSIQQNEDIWLVPEGYEMEMI